MSKYYLVTSFIICITFQAFAQINNSLMERLLAQQSKSVIYWKHVDSGYWQNTPKIIPALIQKTISDSITEEKYHIFSSGLRSLHLSDYPSSQTTYFYYIPTSKIEYSTLKITLANSQIIDFKSTQKPMAKTPQEANQILNSINLFETDLHRYYTLKRKNKKYKDFIIPMSINVVGFGLLGYYALKGEKEGVKGIARVTGGGISAIFSTVLFYQLAKGFFRYKKRGKKMSELEKKLNALNY